MNGYGLDGYYGAIPGNIYGGIYPSSDLSILMPMITLYLVLFGAILLGFIVNYVINGIGLQKMSKKLGKQNGWLAFIPFARTYFRGSLAGEITFKNRKIKNPGLWLLILPIIITIVLIAMYAVFIAIFVAIYATDPYMINFSTNMAIGISLYFLLFLLAATIGQAIIYAINGIVNFKIHKKYVKTNLSVLHMLLGLLVPFYQAIYFLILGKRTPISSDAFEISAPVGETIMTDESTLSPEDEYYYQDEENTSETENVSEDDTPPAEDDSLSSGDKTPPADDDKTN